MAAIKSKHFIPPIPYKGIGEKRKERYEKELLAEQERIRKWHEENPPEVIAAREAKRDEEYNQRMIDRYQKALEPIRHILSDPDSVEIYLIDKPNPNENWKNFLKKKLGGAKLVATFNGEEAKKQVSFFVTDTSLGDMTMCMFDPGIGVLAKKGDEIGEIVICLHCGDLTINGVFNGFSKYSKEVEALVLTWVKDESIVKRLKDESDF